MKLKTHISCKECVRMGERLCSKPSGKCSVERNRLRKNTYVPSRRLSDYGIQLKEKQKARIIYGVMEKQFRGYVNKASKMEGIAGENLLSLLESRLDNVVFRLGLGRSRAQSRQLVSHGHVMVNGKVVDRKSYQIKDGDEISLQDTSQNIPMIIQTLSSNERDVPEYLQLEISKCLGKFIRGPQLTDVPYPVQMEPNLVVEFYSR